MIIYHNHHVIPRHMGGTDEKSNIIRLTVKEHAEEHRLLYEKYGKIEDKIAWKALSSQISIDEAKYLAWVEGSKKGGFAKKPNSVPAHNKSYYHCIYCRKSEKPSAILNGHKKCWAKYTNTNLQNSSYFTNKNGIEMAQKNNSIAICPHCGKSGQYRAMKRWHFDKCKF